MLLHVRATRAQCASPPISLEPVWSFRSPATGCKGRSVDSRQCSLECDREEADGEISGMTRLLRSARKCVAVRVDVTGDRALSAHGWTLGKALHFISGIPDTTIAIN